MGEAALRIFVATQNAGAGSCDDQKQQPRQGATAAGEVIQNALAQPLIPALGRQRVERFIEAKAGAGDEIRARLRDRVQIGEHLEGEDLFALLLATRGNPPHAARVRAPARREVLRTRR